jgi:hypothetical protein
MLADLAHYFGQDLNAAASGDLLTVTGVARGTQRVLRRLLTNKGAYIWEAAYGGSLGAMIGQPFDAEAAEAVVKAQIFLEAAVARTPQPVISVIEIPNGLFISIAYTDSDTGTIVPLSFSVMKPGT